MHLSEEPCPLPLGEVWAEFDVGNNAWGEKPMSHVPNPVSEFYRPVIGEDFSHKEMSFDFTKDSVFEVYAYQTGEGDTDRAWELAGKLDNGSYFYFRCLCDYSGFTCRAAFDIYLTRTYGSLVERAVPADPMSLWR